MNRRIIFFLFVTFNFSIVYFFLLQPTLLNAQSVPDTFGWYQIPNTNLRSVCPPNDFGNSGYNFPSYCQNVTAAWSGAVLDLKRNRLIIWGGGHNDYYGNEIYALNIDTLTIKRITDPGLPLGSFSTCQEAIANGTQANSRHTYGGIAYMSNLDRMFVFGGGVACGPGGVTRDTWTFNFATNLWEKRNPTGTIPNGVPGIVTAYDPNSGKVFLHDDAYLYAYSFDTDNFQRLSNAKPIDYHMTGVIDPVRRKLLIIGGGQQWIYDIGPSSSYAAQNLNSTGGDAIVNSDSPGLAYVPLTGRIVGWNGGNTVYELTMDKNLWNSITYTGGPGNAIPAGTFGRWQYSSPSGLFVAVNSVDANAFTLRLNALDTSDTIPPAPPTGLRIQ